MKKSISQFWRLFLFTGLSIAFLFSSLPAAAVEQKTVSAVDLVILPGDQIVRQGQTFTLTVEARCGSQTTDGIDLFLDFDPAYLTILSAQSGQAFEFELIPPTFDNTAGTFNYSAGRIAPPYPGGDFTLVSLTFQAKTRVVEATSIAFHTDYPRQTIVDLAGSAITGNLFGASITINPDAPLCLAPSEPSSIVSGHFFDLDVLTCLDSAQAVSGVEVYLNFDPTLLEVVDADTSFSGIQVTPGSSLPIVLQNTADNTLGLVSFSAGQLAPPYPTGSFTVASIRFKAKSVESVTTTPLTLAFEGDTVSCVVYEEGIVCGAHSDAAVEIIPAADVEISVVLQGGSRPVEGWGVPLTVNFFASGTAASNSIFTAEPLFSFDLTTVWNDGKALAVAAGLQPGTYDISITSPHCLTSVKSSVTIESPATCVDMGILLEGNANDDDTISILDFGLLAAAYGAGSDDLTYSENVDFDRNGRINITDFGLLAVNYGQNAPIIVGD